MIVEDLYVEQTTFDHFTVFQKTRSGEYINGSGARFSMESGRAVFKCKMPVAFEKVQSSLPLNGFFGSDIRHESDVKKLYNMLDVV